MNSTLKSITRTGFLLGVALVPVLTSGCAGDGADGADGDPTGGGAGIQAAPVDRIVVIVDESGSFEKYLPQAAAIVEGFIQQNAVSGSAEVSLIAMDRHPRVIGFYAAEELLNKQGASVLKAMKATTAEDGTDVVGALDIALFELNKKTASASAPGKRYLIAFSDLYADRQTNPKKVFPQLDAFNWKSLSDLTSARFYFVEQANERKLVPMLEKLGLQNCEVKNEAASNDPKILKDLVNGE